MLIRTYRLIEMVQNKKPNLKPKAKIWLEKRGDPIVGEGRIELLKKIKDTGSLKKASEKMNMSYRHAWGEIEKLEKRLDYKVVKPQKGGKNGGGTKLSKQGKTLVEKFNKIEKKIQKIIEKEKFD